MLKFLSTKLAPMYGPREEKANKKRTLAKIVTSGQKGYNITLILAIPSQLRVIHCQFYDGRAIAEALSACFLALSCQILEKDCVFVYDNAHAPCHKCRAGTAAVRNLEKNDQVTNNKQIKEVFHVKKEISKSALRATIFDKNCWIGIKMDEQLWVNAAKLSRLEKGRKLHNF